MCGKGRGSTQAFLRNAHSSTEGFIQAEGAWCLLQSYQRQVVMVAAVIAVLMSLALIGAAESSMTTQAEPGRGWRL